MVYKVGSPEYIALMKKWSDQAWKEETAAQSEEWAEHEDNYRDSSKAS